MQDLRRTKMAYHNMCRRCRTDDAYSDVSVCERWLDNIDHFVEDMGLCPEGLTLDRINTLGNYEPSNCRWVTRTVQQLNKRISRPGYNDNPLRCITKMYNRWFVRVVIYGRTWNSSFDTLEDAIDCRNQLDYEREIHHLLGAPNHIAT